MFSSQNIKTLPVALCMSSRTSKPSVSLFRVIRPEFCPFILHRVLTTGTKLIPAGALYVLPTVPPP